MRRLRTTRTTHRRLRIVVAGMFALFVLPVAVRHFLPVVADWQDFDDPDMYKKMAAKRHDHTACNCGCKKAFPESLVTLFTTMGDLPGREKMHNNTLYNWASLRPWVRPLLYVDDQRTPLVARAVSLGWTIRLVPRHFNGIPVLRDMFLNVKLYVKTPYYGYANSDILFDQSLLETLNCIQHEDMSSLLVIGRRTNVKVSSITGDVSDLKYVSTLASAGDLFIPNAQDFFITTADGFPWTRVPDFVIGRLGYDNWLVIKAMEWGVKLIDATKTLRNYHQSQEDNNYSGWQSKNRCVNLNMAGPLAYQRGRSSCARWHTQYGSERYANVADNDVILTKRSDTEIPDRCFTETPGRLDFTCAPSFSILEYFVHSLRYFLSTFT